MSETGRTLTIGLLGLVLVVAAILSAPRRATPDEFIDRGETFFPDFADPNAATTLEVVEFDEDTASARPFKVTFKGGVWTIPSHHDYAADGKDQLAKAAAGLIGLKKDDFRTGNVVDHEACGVLDPLDEAASSLKGRGKRVTIKDANDSVLADLIFGKKLEDRPDYRFVRVPDQNRVYVTRSDLDVSTRFADWIEKDLLKVDQNEIREVRVQDYSIDERRGAIQRRDVLILEKNDDEWTANRLNSDQEVDTTKVNGLLRAIDELNIVGVRPKPAGLTADLRQGSVPMSQDNFLALQSKGYYFGSDGSLLSNEGELEVFTEKAVKYTLRFGEVLYGTGEEVSAGAESNQDQESGPGENRYLFVTASFESGRLKEPTKPSNKDFEGKPEDQLTDQDRRNKELQQAHDEWVSKRDEGEKTASELNERFAGWYYVISQDSFDKVHLKRSDLVRKKS